MLSATERQETELAELEIPALLEKIEELAKDKRKNAKPNVPENSSKQKLIAIIHDLSEGEAGTVVRYPGTYPGLRTSFKRT
jgi:hypothetical protein